MLYKKYFLIVQGTFDRKPVSFDYYPTETEIKKYIIELSGETARVEERFILQEETNHII